MRIAVNTAMDAPAQRLLSYVGLEVSLSWRDSPEIHAFLTRLRVGRARGFDYEHKVEETLELGGSGGWALELQGMFLAGSLALVFLGSGRMAMRPD